MERVDSCKSPQAASGRAAKDGTQSFFSRGEWIFFALLILSGIILRWLMLDMRPVHHDESLHIMYGFYFYDHPDINFYKYNPMLHGPFLYNLLRLVYHLLGATEWTARSPITLIGTFFIFIPFLTRRYFSSSAVLILTAAVALSPSLIYWSRFLRHDYVALLWWCLTAYGLIFAPAKFKAPCVLAGITLQFCTKENAYVTAAIIIGYLIFESLFLRVRAAFRKEQPSTSIVSAICRYIRAYPWAVAMGVILSTYLYAYFFTAGFRWGGEGAGFLDNYIGIIKDGLYRKSIMYWMEHHGMERIKGPFLFHFFVLSWYELIFIGAWFGCIAALFVRGGRFTRIGLGVIGVGAVLLLLYYLSFSPENMAKAKETGLWQFFKLKNTGDAIGLYVLLLLSPVVTVHHLLRDERVLAFWGYFATATFFTYSYLGEKVPWLSMYPLVTGLAYFALFFDRYFAERPIRHHAEMPVGKSLIYGGIGLVALAVIFVAEDFFSDRITTVVQIMNAYRQSSVMLLGIVLIAVGAVGRALSLFGFYSLKGAFLALLVLYNLRVAVLVNFVQAGESKELISQVHTTKQFDLLAKRIRYEDRALSKGRPVKVLAEGDAVWPMTSYMIGVKGYNFTAAKDGWEEYDYIIQNWSDKEPVVPPGFVLEKINLRGWWVPNYEQDMSLRGFLNYAMNHQPWSTTGYSHAWLMTKVEERANSGPAAP